MGPNRRSNGDRAHDPAAGRLHAAHVAATRKARKAAEKGPLRLRELLRARPVEGAVLLADLDSSATPGVKRKHALKQLPVDAARARSLQGRLRSEGRRALLVVLQGADTSGKSAAANLLAGFLDVTGCRVTCFRLPTPEEAGHGFLWRVRRALPAPGEVGVFVRSHYEDVLAARVKSLVPAELWERRYEQINAFERGLVASGTEVVKVFLHVSPAERRARLEARLRRPQERWRFGAGELAELELWPEYEAAYDAALTRCCSDCAPWYVVPADRTWYRDWAVTRLLVETLEAMDPREERAELDLRATLERIRQAPAAAQTTS